jgi:hypothetical protein
MPWGDRRRRHHGLDRQPRFRRSQSPHTQATPLVKDLISQLRNTPGKSIVKLKVGDTEVPLTNVVIVGNTIVLS